MSAFALLVMLAIMPAQSATVAAPARIVGRVVSDTNAPVSNAVVSIRPAAVSASGATTALTAAAPSQASSARVRTRTDAAGAFSVELPGRGAYLVDVEATGFFTLSNQALSIDAEHDERAGVTLVLTPIRDFSETVSVSPHASPVDLDQNGSEKTLSGSELLDVPFAGGISVKGGLATLPGVVQDAFGGIHVNGAPEHETLFLLDGFDIAGPLTGGVDPRVTVEAVRSIAVLSGPYSAEYGRGAAGVVSIVSNTGDDRLRYSATNFVPTLSNEKGIHVSDWNPRLTISGPFAPGRAWFTNGVAAEYSQYVVQDLPNGQDTTSGRQISDYLHSQINLTTSNILYASALGSVGTTDHAGLGPLDPVSTTVDINSHQWLFNARDQQLLRGGAVFEVGYGGNRVYVRQQPQGHAPYVSTPSGRSGNAYFDSVQNSSRDQLLASFSPPALHAHQLKVGVEVDRRGYDQDIARSAINLLDAHGNPIRMIAFDGSGALSTSTIEAAAYVQDAWRLRSDLLAQVGIRADRNGLVRDWGASPRAGIAWSPGSGTRLSGGFAVIHEASRILPFVAPDDATPVSMFYPPYGVGTQPVRATFIVPDHLTTRVSRTWSVTLDQRLREQLYLRVQGLDRRQDHGLTYIGTPSVDADTTYTLTNQRTESYDALELSVRQTFRKQYSWMAAYTRSSARSNAVMDVGPDDYFFFAQNQNRGPLSWDAPHRFVSWAYLPTFRPLWSIAYLLEYRTGFPFSAANNAGAIVGPVNAYRYPNYFSLNLDLERRMRFQGNLWALRVGCTNITNHFNPDSVNASVESAQFGQLYGGHPRLLEFRVRWLGRLTR